MSHPLLPRWYSLLLLAAISPLITMLFSLLASHLCTGNSHSVTPTHHRITTKYDHLILFYGTITHWFCIGSLKRAFTKIHSLLLLSFLTLKIHHHFISCHCARSSCDVLSAHDFHSLSDD